MSPRTVWAEGVRVAVGSPYGCEHGDEVEPGASEMPIGTPYSNPCNPAILQARMVLALRGSRFTGIMWRCSTGRKA